VKNVFIDAILYIIPVLAIVIAVGLPVFVNQSLCEKHHYLWLHTAQKCYKHMDGFDNIKCPGTMINGKCYQETLVN
jgi:hypothetical protein